jgi:hypothetical protein
MYYDTIRLSDPDGDGRADLCIRGPAGFACYLNDGVNFSSTVPGPALADAYGWGQAPYYTTLDTPDIDGDDRDDVCVRGPDRVHCWASTGTGFGEPIEGPPLTDAFGWGVEPYHATMRWADLDADGRDDLCVRGVDQVYCWTSRGTSFSDAIAGPPLSDALGWTDHSNYATLALADRTGDGRADLCARGDAGMVCYASTGVGFGEAQLGPAWGDAQGWASLEAYDTIAFVGGRAAQGGVDTGITDDSGGADTDDDSGDGDGPGSPLDGDGGCGCASGGAGPAGLGWLVAGALVAGGRRGRGASRHGGARGLGGRS